MEDEALAETDTEAPSDGSRPHPIPHPIHSRAGSHQQQQTPEERKAKQKADKAESTAKACCRPVESQRHMGYLITSGRGGQPRMGWRKLAVRDDTLARCSEARGPVGYAASLSLPGGTFLIRQHCI